MNELCIMKYSFKREYKAGLRDTKDRVRRSNRCLIRVSQGHNKENVLEERVQEIPKSLK